jgi:predicted AAA+ superfamily ATPase
VAVLGTTHEKRALENIVYNELYRRYKNVVVGLNGHKEIDFIVINGDKKYYIQTAFNLNETAVEDKLSSFIKIDDGYKKIIIIDRYPHINNQKGYLYLDIFDFLIDDLAIEKIY